MPPKREEWGAEPQLSQKKKLGGCNSFSVCNHSLLASQKVEAGDPELQGLAG